MDIMTILYQQLNSWRWAWETTTWIPDIHWIQQKPKYQGVKKKIIHNNKTNELGIICFSTPDLPRHRVTESPKVMNGVALKEKSMKP